MAEHVGAADTGPAWVVGAEHLADVAEACGAEQRVAQRVGRDVAVGVAGAAVCALEKQSEQPARPARLDRVHVGADSHPRHAHIGLFQQGLGEQQIQSVW